MELLMDPVVIGGIIVIAIVFLVITIIWGVRAHRGRVEAGREDLVGRVAETKTVMDPRGTVFLEGEHWTAISESGRIEAGEEVIVSRVDGMKLLVNKKKEV